MGWFFKYLETLKISTLDPTHWSAKRLLTPKSCCSQQFMNKGNILFSYVILNYAGYSLCDYFNMVDSLLHLYYLYSFLSRHQSYQVNFPMPNFPQAKIFRVRRQVT